MATCYCCACFLATGAAVYPFFDKIVALLLKPLGNNLSLVYLTPGVLLILPYKCAFMLQ